MSTYRFDHPGKFTQLIAKTTYMYVDQAGARIEAHVPYVGEQCVARDALVGAVGEPRE
jgi:hypothetical protein